MKELNILFASAGRRVSLLRHFRKVLNECGIKGNIVAADAGSSAPASYVADVQVAVPRVDDPQYIQSILTICKEQKIGLVISLIDTDLILLSEQKKIFDDVGVRVLVCSSETNKICFDKNMTNNFFVTHNIGRPYLYSDSELNELSETQLPLFLKPFDGSCSVGTVVVKSMKELSFFREYTVNPMVQEKIEGEEYTCDAYVDFNGTVRCVVPRLRIETRAGEVSKGMTVYDESIINAVTDVCNKLPGTIGCLTVQCFKTKNGEIKFIEVNPRFGGGHPLSIHAGADFPRWIVQECVSGVCEAAQDSWRPGVVMLRYDDEVIVSRKDIYGD